MKYFKFISIYLLRVPANLQLLAPPPPPTNLHFETELSHCIYYYFESSSSGLWRRVLLTWRRNPEELDLHLHHREHFVSRIIILLKIYFFRSLRYNPRCCTEQVGNFSLAFPFRISTELSMSLAHDFALPNPYLNNLSIWNNVIK
jgi:hypothetical protein